MPQRLEAFQGGDALTALSENCKSLSRDNSGSSGARGVRRIISSSSFSGAVSNIRSMAGILDSETSTCETTGMPEAGDGDVGLFQALPGPHSPKPVRYSPTGDSHWATDTTAGRISREVTERQFEQERLAPHSAPTNRVSGEGFYRL